SEEPVLFLGAAAAQAEVEWPVGGLVAVVGRLRGAVEVEAVPLVGIGLGAPHDTAQVQERAERADGDRLAAPCPLALDQRRQDGLEGEEGGGRAGDVGAEADRWLAD